MNASAGSAQRTPRWRRIAEAFDAVHVVIHDASSAVELVEATSDKRRGGGERRATNSQHTGRGSWDTYESTG